MIFTTSIVLVLEVVSLILMALMLMMFRQVQKKQFSLLHSLHDAPPTLVRHRTLLAIYIVTTLLIGICAFLLYAFDPHILL